MNFANGAGNITNPSLANYLSKFRAAGIVVLGYVYTRGTTCCTSGTRNLIGSDSVNGIYDYNRGVEQAIDAWASFYTLDGIFLDNGPKGNASSPALGYPGHTLLQYYQTATAYAKNNGFTIVFGNPGGGNTTGFIGSVDVINSIESATLETPSEVALQTIAIGGNASQWSIIANNNTSPPTASYLESISNCVGWIYVSDTNGEHYDSEPSYQATTVANLEIVDSSASSSSSVNSQIVNTSLTSSYDSSSILTLVTSVTTRTRTSTKVSSSTKTVTGPSSSLSTSTANTSSSKDTLQTSNTSSQLGTSSLRMPISTSIVTPVDRTVVTTNGLSNILTSQSSRAVTQNTIAFSSSNTEFNTVTTAPRVSSFSSVHTVTSIQEAHANSDNITNKTSGLSLFMQLTSIRYGIIAYETSIIVASPVALVLAKRHASSLQSSHSWQW